MSNRQVFEEKSRLGRLLVNRGYLSDSQLVTGLKCQRETGQRLGDVLVQSGWITERDLNRVLKHQSRYRNAAAFFTMVALPFQPMISFASGTHTADDPLSEEAGQMISEGTFEPLTDQEMAAVSGKEDAALSNRFAWVGFEPVLSFLDYDLTFTGVHYQKDRPHFSIQNDGALEFTFPERIEQIHMENLRVGSGPSVGSITISDVRFHAGSSMTVRAR